VAGLAEKVAFLSDPRAYPGAAGPVEVRETRMSFVFLTADRAWKLKKPVTYPHLDFGSVAARRRWCAAELRLNRRLAAETYLGVAALRAAPGGGLALGWDGAVENGPQEDWPVEDWLVVMRRLPAAEMMDARIRDGRLTPADVARLAARLGDFYAGLPGEAGGAYAARLARELARDREVLTAPRFGLAAEAVLAAAEAGLAARGPEIAARAARGRVVEGHGDLRPEHVHLGDPVQVIDCLEFDRDFRLADPFDEAGYLGLECAILGDDRVGPALVAALADRPGDPPSAGLQAVYGMLRALTRARLCLTHLDEPRVRTPEKWRPLALRYLAAAEALSPRAR
jgi:uncharacterized protein